MRTGSGTSRITPTSSVISVGVPHPTLSIGPNTYRSFAGGKIVRMSLMICAASRTGSGGNRIESRWCARIASRSASSTIVRLIPARPPKPFSVNPNPSWIGGRSNVRMIRKLNPDEPSGSFVSRTAIALIEMPSNDIPDFLPGINLHLKAKPSITLASSKEFVKPQGPD